MSKIFIWLKAIRLQTLPIGLMPVILASYFAYLNNYFNLTIFLAICLATLLLQSITNIANDLYDHIQGADTEKRQGSKRTAANNLLSHSELKYGIIVCTVSSLIIGSYLVFIGGTPVLMTGILSILFAIAYTAKPFSLAYRGFGELLVIVFFGLIAVNVTYYIYSYTFSIKLFLFSLCLGAIQSAVLIVNNIRDEETDRACDKRTLVVKFGKKFGQIEYTLCLILSLIPILIILIQKQSIILLILSLILFVLYISLIREVFCFKKSSELNSVLGQTALSIILYTACLCETLRLMN